jgi:hypothetical protein
MCYIYLFPSFKNARWLFIILIVLCKNALENLGEGQKELANERDLGCLQKKTRD